MMLIFPTRKLFCAATAVALLCMSHAPAFAGAAEDEAAKQCDLLAASPRDLTKPADVAGVSGDDVNGPAAIAACQKAATAFPDDARMAFQLGRALSSTEGRGAEAFAPYKKAAEAGHVVAMFNLAGLYYDGTGTVKNHAVSSNWYRKAADAGFDLAQVELGIRHLTGEGVERNVDEAIFHFEKAGAQGNASAFNELGSLFSNSSYAPKDLKKAIAYFEQAIDLGDTISLESLARIYQKGEGGIAVDHAKANALLQKAIAQGDFFAMNAHAENLMSGRGVPQDEKAAIALFRNAFDAGSIEAAFHLGRVYASGRLVPADNVKAADYFIVGMKPHYPKIRDLFVANAGAGLTPELINLVQDRLIAGGGKIEKRHGVFGDDAIARMNWLMKPEY